MARRGRKGRGDEGEEEKEEERKIRMQLGPIIFFCESSSQVSSLANLDTTSPKTTHKTGFGCDLLWFCNLEVGVTTGTRGPGGCPR